MGQFIPEMGQMAFGQPSKEFSVGPLLEAALGMIDDNLRRLMWNRYQREYPSPFSNTGNRFKCDAFEVAAYSWDDSYEQPFNFKWRDIEVSWYKYCCRGTSVNAEITPEQINEMLIDCLCAITALEGDDLLDNEPEMPHKEINEAWI